MGTILGLLGMVVFILCVIALAAGVTLGVVKISPAAKGDASKAPAKQ